MAVVCAESITLDELEHVTVLADRFINWSAYFACAV